MQHFQTKTRYEIGPQYFYGFWGQYCNDYRSVKPHEHEGGRDKNYGQKNEGKQTLTNCRYCINEYEGSAYNVAQGPRHSQYYPNASRETETTVIAVMIGHPSIFKGDDEDYHIMFPKQTSRAFFVLTSNVDAHSFDVFESHEIRECHGNVEMWQCHNFACGTNATIDDDGVSLEGIDGTADDGDDDEEEQRAQKWQRVDCRLWRLSTDHHFSVDCNLMCAPCS